MKTPCLFGYSRHRAARGPIRFRVHSFSCSFTDSSSRTNTCKKRVNRLPPSVIYRGSRKIRKSQARPLAARSSGGASTPALVVPRRPPPLAMSSHPARRELPREAHAVLRMNKQGLPRYPEVSGQELKKTFVVRAPKPAENGKAPSTPSSSSSARGVFVGRCVRDADVPRRDGAAPPGTGATTTTRSRVSFCRLVCRFNEGAGGGVTAPDPLFPHVNMRSHSVHVRSCSFTGVWAHAVCFHEYLCS